MRPQRCLSAAWVAIVVGTLPAAAQAWTAQLMLSPMPSPFVSDWEVDPSVAELIVTNGTATATAVTFHYTLARGSQIVLRGVTDAHTVGGSESKVFNASTTFGGKADWNRELQDIVARTGRLPEGEYQGCVALAGPGGVVLIERECATFTVGYPDPPFLVHPMNGDTVRSQAPMFEWQPVQLPAMADARVGYVLQVAEVNPATRQSPEVALSSNILHYVEPGLVETFHQYPVGGLPLVSGRTYAWRVQALDATGKPIASNQGRSEIWTFVYREPESEAERTVARVELTASRDTLRFAGDTTRYSARAFDADNVEIVGRVAQWRALDTSVVRVDSTGVVTAAKLGETRVVASIDGVADSAVTVMAARGLAVRFERYDAANESPSFLELVKSGSFNEVAPKLMALLQAGELVIPIPRLPGVEATFQPAESPPNGAEFRDSRDADARARGGPFAPRLESTRGHIRQAACNDVAFDVTEPYMSLDERVFVFYLPFNRQQWQETTNCLGVPNESGEVEEAERTRGALFVVSWDNLGFPRAFLAFKGPGMGLTMFGPKVYVRYLVINILAPVTVGADILPANFDGFFGDVSFAAGTGATFYSIRRCYDAVTRLCQILTWLNPENPDITIEAFAGVTATEASGQIGTGGLKSVKGGASLAKGFSIQASLPVAYPKFGPDSLQLGVMFAVQDSMVAAPGADPVDHNKSLGVALTPTVWWTSYWPDGTKRNDWELSGSIGLEIDPSNPSDAPNAVVSLQVPAIWTLGVFRLGNPQMVITKPLERGGELEVAISGTWGFGPPAGIGLASEEGGGSGRSDAGGAERGSVAGFEELGRGTLSLKLTPLPPGQARDSAISAVEQTLAKVRAAEKNVEEAKATLEDAKAAFAEQYAIAEKAEGRAPSVLDDPILRAFADEVSDAEKELASVEAKLSRHQRDLTRQQADRDKAIQDAKDDEAKSGKPKASLACTTVVGGLCLTWTLQGSLNTTAMADLIAAALRAIPTGVQAIRGGS